MGKRKVKFKIYKLSNLLMNIDDNSTNPNYYNHRIVNFILNNIMSHSKNERKRTYNHKTETVYLASYNPFYSAEYAAGQIITIRHGKEQRNVDVDDLSLVGLILTNHGIEYTVDFFIHKKTGLIFLEQDENYVLTIYKLRTLLRLFSKDTRQFIRYLNTHDEKYHIDYKPVINIEIIKAINIKEQIKSLHSVKSVSLFEKENIQHQDIEDINFDSEDENNFFKNIYKGINTSNINGYDTSIRLSNFSERRLAGNLEKFIDYVIDCDKFGGYSIEGKDAYGINRIFTPDSLTRDIQFETEADVKGLVAASAKNTFIDSYLKDNDKNLPKALTRKEPDFENLADFIKKFVKFKGDLIDEDKEDKD